MARLTLSLACWNYAHTRALLDGRVKADGIDFIYLPLTVEETFLHMVRHREFDVAELSLSSYCVSLMKDDPAFIAIPVFPSRSFRHSGITISAKANIKKPADLASKRIGCPEYQLTAIVWQRGIMQDEYGVDPKSAFYLTGGQNEPGRDEKLKLNLPPDIRVESIGVEKTLSQMIAEGEIDALYSPHLPTSFYARPNDVKRLFENYAEIERAYYAKTKIFPIMHVIVIRRDLYQRAPWVALATYKAFAAAQKITYTELSTTNALSTMLPWQIAEVERLQHDMGKDWWPYGFAPNKNVLETFLRYHHEQGLSQRLLKPEELFAPEAMESSKI